MDGGLSKKPYLLGATFSNKELGFTDLHLKSIEYRKEYLSHFIETDNMMFINKLTGVQFTSEKECVDNLLKNHKDLLE